MIAEDGATADVVMPYIECHGFCTGAEAAYGETAVLSVACAYQQSTDWHKRRPPAVQV
ncbi:MAG: hypothetical protein WAM39_18705 [Bryobacteraceae bacterium]